MQAHINLFNQLDESLKAIGINLEDTLRMTILLASLPASYKSVVSAIESYIEAELNAPPVPMLAVTTLYPPVATPGPNFDYVTRCLLNEERKRILDYQQTHGITDADTKSLPFKGNVALAAQSSHRRPPVKDIVCFNCNKKGHYRNNCPRGSNRLRFCME